MLKALPVADRPAYIEARSYFRRLFSCGIPHLVGSGFLQPDGEFQVCWRWFPKFLPPNCHEEVAYVVKQLVNGVTLLSTMDGSPETGTTSATRRR